MTENFPRRLPRPANGPEMGKSSAMCTLTLIYHEAFEPAVMGIIQRGMTVARYTKISDVLGARTDMMQEIDYQSDGKNQMLIICAEEQVIQEIAEELRDLRRAKRHGLRGYITPVLDVI